MNTAMMARHASYGCSTKRNSFAMAASRSRSACRVMCFDIPNEFGYVWRVYVVRHSGWDWGYGFFNVSSWLRYVIRRGSFLIFCFLSCLWFSLLFSLCFSFCLSVCLCLFFSLFSSLSHTHTRCTHSQRWKWWSEEETWVLLMDSKCMWLSSRIMITIVWCMSDNNNVLISFISNAYL